MIGYEGFGPAIETRVEQAQTELMIQLSGEAYAAGTGLQGGREGARPGLFGKF